MRLPRGQCFACMPPLILQQTTGLQKVCSFPTCCTGRIILRIKRVPSLFGAFHDTRMCVLSQYGIVMDQQVTPLREKVSLLEKPSKEFRNISDESVFYNDKHKHNIDLSIWCLFLACAE